MKSLIIGFLCATMSGNPTPDTTSNNVFIPNGERSRTETIISGDANKDGKLNIADAVILQQYLTSGIYEHDDLSRIDINSDGIIDSFDIIIMRQTILNPESAVSRTYSIDILNSAEILTQHEEIFTSADEVSAYLSEFIFDTSELQMYLERYDETFFEENNLVLVPFVQERGKGIYYNISGFGKMHPDFMKRSVGEEIFLTLSADYSAYKPLYPVTNTQLLVQATIPKSQSHKGDFVSWSDESENSTNMSSHIYLSPDGKHEITVTQETQGNISDIRVFLRTGKISFKALTYMNANGEKPFTDNGEWSADSDGNNVFGNGTTYSITWLENAVIIDHQVDGNYWEKIHIPFEGEDVTEEYYTKE